MQLRYRQKVFLSLLEVFGSPISKIDFVKILFLYCQNCKKAPYSFFPYLRGCYSFEFAKDKNTLFKNDLIINTPENLGVKHSSSYLQTLTVDDRQLLLRLKRQLEGVRGKDLLRKTYKDYPEFIKRSIIKHEILTLDELALVESSGMLFEDDAICLYSIGYEGITIDEYLRRLIKNDITLVLDVRKKPYSMKFDFNKSSLMNYLGKVGIKYLGIPDLGIPEELRGNLKCSGDYASLFEYYETYCLPEQAFHLEFIAENVMKGEKIALTCFEKEPTMCHRTKIAQRLNSEYKIEIINL